MTNQYTCSNKIKPSLKTVYIPPPLLLQLLTKNTVVDKMSTLQTKYKTKWKNYIRRLFKPPVFPDNITQHGISQNICQAVLQTNHQNSTLCCLIEKLTLHSVVYLNNLFYGLGNRLYQSALCGAISFEVVIQELEMLNVINIFSLLVFHKNYVSNFKQNISSIVS